jgi:hypothetical protein
MAASSAEQLKAAQINQLQREEEMRAYQESVQQRVMEGLARRQAELDEAEKISETHTKGASQEESHIGYGAGALMLLMALAFDGLQALGGLIFTASGFLIPIGIVVNLTLSLVAWIFFYIWLKVNGISILSKRGAGLGISAVSELIPFFNWLPAWTAYILYLLVSQKVSSSIKAIKNGSKQ